MTKLQILNAYLTERLMVAVREILEVVGDTVAEYQEETARIHRENEDLRRELREAVTEAEAGWTGAGHPLSLSLPPGAALPLSLSEAEGRFPGEQQHGEQEWSSGLREEAELTLSEEEEEEEVVVEEEQRPRVRQRRRQKEEDPDGMGLPCAMEAEPGAEPELQPECAAPGLKKLALEIALSVVSPSALSASHDPSVAHGNDDEAAALRTHTLGEDGLGGGAQVKTEPAEGLDFQPEQPPELGPGAGDKHRAPEPALEESDSKPSGVNGAGTGHTDGYEIRGAASAGHPDGPEQQEAPGAGLDDVIQNDGYLIGYRGERQQHRCFQCGKTFTQVCNLKTHLQIHSGERPYACNWCGKCFTQSADLRRHQRIHTGEKPHRCTWCEKSFTQIGNLKRHLRIHTGERPYCCGLCGKSFNDGDTLKKHRRIHTGERPFRCAHCPKTFTVASSLQNHLRNHQKEGRH